MPATFPTHTAAPLPLKLWQPRWFDGVALVLGAVAPDLAYPLDGSGLPVWPFSHQLLGLLGWCLPIVLAGCWLVRRAAPVVAVHLPAAGPLALRDYGAIRTSGHRWWVTAYSGILGAATHLVLDGFEATFPATALAGHLVGAAGMLALLVHIGRRRLLREWHGAPPSRRARPVVFWSVVGVVALPAAALVPFLPAAFLPHTTTVRLLTALGAGLLLAAAAVEVRSARVGSGPGASA